VAETNGHLNGHQNNGFPARPVPTEELNFTAFPKDHRRLIPGEHLEAGDLVRDCTKRKTPWRPVGAHRLGREVTYTRFTYARPLTGSKPPMWLIHNYMFGLVAFVIEESWLVESLATDQFTRKRCQACGGRGTINEQVLADMEEDGVEIVKPPRDYVHCEDCPVQAFSCSLMMFEDAFDTYLRTYGVKFHEEPQST